MDDSVTHTRRRWLKSAVLAAGAAGLPRPATAAVATDDREAVMRALLDRNHGLHPEYNHGFSNHLSMGVVRWPRSAATPAASPRSPPPSGAGSSRCRRRAGPP